MPKRTKQTKIVPVKASSSVPINFEFGREMDRNDPNAGNKQLTGNNKNSDK